MTPPSPAVTEALALLAQYNENIKACENCAAVSGLAQRQMLCNYHTALSVLRALVDEIQQAREDRDIQDEIQRSVSVELLETEKRADALQADLQAANEILDRKTGLIADLTTACHVHSDGARRWKENLTLVEAERDALTAQIEGLREYVQHKRGCSSLPCDGHSNGECCTVECQRGDGPCDCGLDARLASSSAETGENV